MPKNFTGTYTTTQVLSSLTDNPVTVTSTGIINVNTAGAVGLFAITYPWNITNLGTVESLGSLSYGIDLVSGGSVTNGPGGYSSALIEGTRFGIVITGAAGTVVNYGTIESPGTFSYGVFLTAGGTVTNGSVGATGALIDGGTRGVAIVGGVGTVTNFGTVESTYGSGVRMDAGGTVANYGTIAGTGLSGIGVALVGGGSVTNGASGSTSGVITGGGTGVLITGSAGTIDNFGTVAQTGTAGFQAISLGTGTVTNLGLISAAGTNASAINIGTAGGTIVNGQSGTTLGLITAYHTGIGFFPGTAGSPGTLTVVNYGRIQSTQSGPAVGTGFNGFAINTGTNSTSVIDNFGTIAASQTAGGGGILLAGGQITNEAGALIDGAGGNGISSGINGAAITVTNLGTVQNASTTNSTVYLGHGGSVTNGAASSTGAAIVGAGANSSSISIHTATGTVVNFGTVANAGTFNNAVYLGAGGSVTNAASGTIVASWVGVNLKNVAGTVSNLGTIESTATFLQSGSLRGVGVILQQGGTVVNGATGSTGGLIEAYEIGVYIGGGGGTSNSGAVGLVFNYGTIASIGTGANAGAAAELSSGGTITNFGQIQSVAGNAVQVKGTVAGTVINYGTIEHTGTGTSGGAVDIAGGGLLTNSGLIRGGRAPIVGATTSYGGVVTFRNQPGTIHNFGTVATTNDGNGVNLLAGGTLVNGAIDATAATITASRTGIYIGGSNGTPTSGAVGFVFNYGTIESTTTYAPAVRLVSGGTAVNYGLIESARTGISFGNTAGTIDNFGTIISTAPLSGTRGSGVYLGAGGLITNEAGASIAAVRAAVSLAFFGTTSADATVINAGTLTGSTGISTGSADTGNNTVVNSGTIIGTGDNGVYFGAGGTVTNSGSGLIRGTGDVIFVNNGYGTVVNDGTIENTGESGDGVFLDAGGSVANIGSIQGDDHGVEINGAAGTVTNSGTIQGTAGYGVGVALYGGGGVSNAVAGALITGRAVGVRILGGGSVSNDGTIEATGAIGERIGYGIGVALDDGGGVTNAATSALISGLSEGVSIGGTAAGTLANLGTVAASGGTGVFLRGGGSVANGQPSATAALISGTNYGVRALYGATITNYSTIAASGKGISLGAGGYIANSGLISGGTDVVFADGSVGTIANSGTILGTTGPAIWLNAGGTVTNGGSGLIRGTGDVVFANNGLGTVVNDGTIDNTGPSGDGVCLDAGGSVINTGSIQGYDHGVEINSPGGAVTNSGIIAAVGEIGIGVYLKAAGSTVTNAGTISGAGGTAVAFSGGGNRLIVDPGAVFSGVVNGGTGGDTLELASTAGSGAISGLGTQYLGFTAVTVDAGARWSLSGSNTLGAGVTLTDLGTLTNLGSLSGAGNLVVDPASLVNSGYIGMTVTLLGGGYLNNTATGTINAAGVAVYGTAGAATIVNVGTMNANGVGSSGVFLRGGGSVANGQPGSATAAISGIQYGIRAEGVPATVTNYGTISGGGRGVGLRAGGSVTNAVGGTISGTSSSVYFTGGAGAVANHGLIAVGGTYGTGVQLNAGGTVANSGTIASTGKHGIAVYLASGSVTNTGTGLISAVAYNDVAFGVVVAGPAGNVVNAGTVDGASEGVWLEGGGTVTNSGSIAGTGIAGGGVRFGDQSGIVGAAGTVFNSGTVTGNVRGVFLDGGGSVTNGASGAPGGSIQGYLRGVASYLSAATVTNYGTIAATAVNGIGIDFTVSGSTVTNAGTISGAGGTAVAFSGGGNRLTVDPGAVFSGVVDAGAAAGDVLELAAGAATGTIGGLGSSFTGFDSAAVDASAVWLLSGTNALGAGTTLSNSGTLEIGSALTLGGNVVNTGVIDIEAGVRLTLATAVTGAGSIAFIGSGGTLEIDGTTMPANTISGFAAGDSIDLPNIVATSISYAGGVVSLLNGTTTVAQLSVATPYANPAFAENPDNTGGTLITVAPPPPPPPAPSGLALSPLSDSGVAGDNLTNVAAPSIIGTGEVGDTVMLFDGGTPVGSSTVGAGGAWAVTASGLSPGAHVLSATESNGAGNVSAPSAGLSITIDQSAPVTVAVSLSVASGSLPTPLGIAAPSDPDNPAGSLDVTVGQLPTNGSVTLADGITAVTPGEVLSIAQLTGLKFTPASNQIGSSSSFTYTVTDPAGNSSAGSATATIATPIVTSVFNFIFTYADGKDYYLGSVADNGGFGYWAGQQIVTGAGRYDIFNKEGSVTLAPSGTVLVTNYSHGGPGAASTLPVGTAAGRPDGTGGLGSESDAVPGIDGRAHPFSSTQPASFGAATALFGFVYSYSDGAAFYSGSVVDDGTFGLSGAPDAAFSRTVTDNIGTVLGTYSIFRNGVSTLAPGSVVIDRFTTGDASFVTNRAGLGAVDGSSGLGSEVGRITRSKMAGRGAAPGYAAPRRARRSGSRRPAETARSVPMPATDTNVMVPSRGLPSRPLIAGPSAWIGADMRGREAEWSYRLAPPQVAEIDAAVAAVRARGLDIAEISRADFPLPTFGPVLDRLRAEVLDGRGFVLLRGMPVEDRPIAETATAYWGVGTYFGSARSQNAKGHLLGHVYDLGTGLSATNPNLRSYATAERQNFHIDRCDVVALLCLRRAKSGGLSTIVSSMSVHNAMAQRRPDLLERLYRPFPVDRRGEVPEGKAPFYEAPVFNEHAGTVSVLYSRLHIGSSQRFPEAPRLTPEDIEALDMLGELAADPELRLDMNFMPGDIQFLHNHTILHARSAYADWPEAERKRHLLRLWLAPPVARALPPVFAECYGAITIGDRGGIICNGTRLHAPLAPG